MEGGEEVECRGMIPRAVEQVFSSAAALREKGWEVRAERGVGKKNDHLTLSRMEGMVVPGQETCTLLFGEGIRS